MTDIVLNNPTNRSLFAELLQKCRRRTPADAHIILEMLRSPERVGKPVSQGEVARAVGIDRRNYAMLERGIALTVAPTMLARIATALSMNEAERNFLADLVVPEVSSKRFDKSCSSVAELASMRLSLPRFPGQWIMLQSAATTRIGLG